MSTSRSYRRSMGAFLVAALALALPAVDAVAQPGPVEQLQEQYEQAGSDEQRLVLLGQIEHAALRTGGGVIHSGGLVYAGHGYYRLELNDDALRCFRAVPVRPDNADDSIDALRMQGQISMNRGAVNEATTAYTRQLALVLAMPDIAQYSEQLKMSAFGLSAMQQRSRRFAESFATRSILLNTPGVVLDDSERAVVLLENARDARADGRPHEAAIWYNRLFEEVPAFGHDDGSIVSLLVESIRAAGLPESSLELTRRLTAVWQDPRLSNHDQIYTAGHYLAHVLADGQGRHPESEQVLGELTQRLDIAWPTLTEDRRQGLTTIRVDALLRMGRSAELAGRLEVALSRYLDLITRFPNHPQADLAMRRADALWPQLIP